MPVFREYMVQQPLSGSAAAGWKKQEVNQVFAAASTQASQHGWLYAHIPKAAKLHLRAKRLAVPRLSDILLARHLGQNHPPANSMGPA